MKKIKFAPLYYYVNNAEEERYCIGVLFYDTETKKRNFAHIKNLERIKAMHDDSNADIYIKDIEDDIYNYEKYNYESFNIDDYTRYARNNHILNGHYSYLRFGDVKDIKVDEDYDYVTYITKLYLKFDFKKEERIN